VSHSLLIPIPERAELMRRLPRLIWGLALFGWGLALMVASDLGLAPWEVLHQGVSRHTPIPIGTVGIITGVLVLVLWFPLRERFGLGTLLNVVIIGVVIDVTLIWLAVPGSLAVRWAYLLVGLVMVAIASGYYIGAGLGPGPRDGLMTGLARRGMSLGVVRTGIEVAVLAGGWLLGGTVGVGTVLFSFGIGPLVQFFLPRLSLEPLG
jgi:uncharacterized membrane protein YczE